MFSKKILYKIFSNNLKKLEKKELKKFIDKVRGKGAPQARIRGYLFILFFEKVF
jgi:hypothetical protein